MTERPAAELLTRMLVHISAGSAEAKIDGTLVATIDGEDRKVTIDLDPLLDAGSRTGALLPEGGLPLWRNRGLPSALARSGWQVSVVSESHELLRMGRGVSRLTGHVHASPRALWKLRRIL